MVELPTRFIQMSKKAVDKDQRGAESGSSILFFLDICEPRLSALFAVAPIIHLGMGNTTILLSDRRVFSRIPGRFGTIHFVVGSIVGSKAALLPPAGP